jgi:hydroxymethylpyrimidine pyrophosphatase-like HAD family hydrolase
MRWIKLFENFVNDEAVDVLYIFDFDDTLVQIDKEGEPSLTKELSKLYKKVLNKSIVTGRPKETMTKVEGYLEIFGLENPNWGLFCSPHGENENLIPGWKAETIVRLLKDSGFKIAKFYDDKPDWVNTVVKAVKSELPDVEFEGIVVEKSELNQPNTNSELKD